MSEGLLTQWRDRVVEAETEISLVQEDITAILSRRRELKQDISRYDKLVQREKQDMLRQLEEVEAKAQELEECCRTTMQHKSRVEEMYVQTLDNYESMHDTVKAIQADEQQLEDREDVETVLHRESLAWAEEEHRLRAKLDALQSALRARRKERHEEVTALNTHLAASERQLQQVRQERQGDMQAQQHQHNNQQLQQATKHSRNGTPHAFVRRAVSTASEANCKEQQFIAANASTSIPTRQLRSCLKNTSNTTDSCSGNDPSRAQSGNYSRNMNATASSSNALYDGLPAHYKSAPVSRATSQTLVADNGPLVCGVGSGHATPHRAYSYVAGKKAGSKKRDIHLLGDATNF